MPSLDVQCARRRALKKKLAAIQAEHHERWADCTLEEWLEKVDEAINKKDDVEVYGLMISRGGEKYEFPEGRGDALLLKYAASCGKDQHEEDDSSSGDEDGGGGAHGVATEFIKKKADVNAVGEDGRTALHITKSEYCANQLLTAGASVQVTCKSGQTPLHIWSQRGCEGILKAVLDKGAVVDAKDTSGTTSLMLASGQGHLEAVELLLKHGATASTVNSEGKTALHFGAASPSQSASQSRSRDVCQRLLVHKADPSARDSEGLTALEVGQRAWDDEDLRVSLLEDVFRDPEAPPAKPDKQSSSSPQRTSFCELM